MAKQTINKIPAEVVPATTDKSLQDYIDLFDMTPPANGLSYLVIDRNLSTWVPVTSATMAFVFQNSDNWILKRYSVEGVLGKTEEIVYGTVKYIDLFSTDALATPFGLITKYTIEPKTSTNKLTTYTTACIPDKSTLKIHFGAGSLDEVTTMPQINTSFGGSLIEIIMPASADKITTMGTFLNSLLLCEKATLPTSMALVTDFANALKSQKLEHGTMPSTTGIITTMANICDGNKNQKTFTFNEGDYNSLVSLASAWYLNYLLEEIEYFPTSLNALTTLANAFDNTKLIHIPLPISLPLITTIGSMCQNAYYLETISECTNWGAGQVDATRVVINAYKLTTFKQSALKVSKIGISATSAKVSAVNSIDIDYTNSLFTGAAPQVDYIYNSLPKTELERIFGLLPYIAAGKTMAITGNIGADALISKASSGATADSVTVTIADTSNLTAGMEVYGTGLDTAIACTVQTDVDTITKAAHGLTDGMIVSFATIVTSTGFTVYQPYFVVNRADDTFQIALTDGGTAIDLTGSNGSGTYLTQPVIASIAENVSITLDRPASATGTVTVTAGVLKRSIAKFKKWTLTN